MIFWDVKDWNKFYHAKLLMIILPEFKGTATLKIDSDIQALIKPFNLPRTNLMEIEYKIRKLDQFENQNFDFC